MLDLGRCVDASGGEIRAPRWHLDNAKCEEMCAWPEVTLGAQPGRWADKTPTIGMEFPLKS